MELYKICAGIKAEFTLAMRESTMPHVFYIGIYLSVIGVHGVTKSIIMIGHVLMGYTLFLLSILYVVAFLPRQFPLALPHFRTSKIMSAPDKYEKSCVRSLVIAFIPFK